MSKRSYGQDIEAEQRQNRRMELVRLGHMRLEDLPTPSLTDPPEYLESLRLPLIQRLKKTLEETEDEELGARICVNLLKFSSMGRSSVDLVHSLKRDELPDLSKLFSEADLERLVDASPAALEGLAKRLEIAEQATRSSVQSQDHLDMGDTPQ